MKATAQMGGLTREQVEEWRNALCDYNRWTDEGISEIDQLCDLALQGLKLGCPRPQIMGEHACKDRTQCWEPCGDLGHHEEYARPVPPPERP